MPGQKFVTKERITVRNLRIREDTVMVGKVINNLAEYARNIKRWLSY